MNIFERLLNAIIDDRTHRRMQQIEMKRLEQEHEESLIERQITCQSCEALKLEIARLHDQNNRLIEGILEKPEPEKPMDTRDLKPILPQRHLNWNSRRQMLEEADRDKARAMRHKADELKAAGIEVPVTQTTTTEPLTTSQIEQELGIDSAVGDNNGN